MQIERLGQGRVRRAQLYSSLEIFSQHHSVNLQHSNSAPHKLYGTKFSCALSCSTHPSPLLLLRGKHEVALNESETRGNGSQLSKIIPRRADSKFLTSKLLVPLDSAREVVFASAPAVDRNLLILLVSVPSDSANYSLEMLHTASGEVRYTALLDLPTNIVLSQSMHFSDTKKKGNRSDKSSIDSLEYMFTIPCSRTPLKSMEGANVSPKYHVLLVTSRGCLLWYAFSEQDGAQCIFKDSVLSSASGNVLCAALCGQTLVLLTTQELVFIEVSDIDGNNEMISVDNADKFGLAASRIQHVLVPDEVLVYGVHEQRGLTCISPITGHSDEKYICDVTILLQSTKGADTATDSVLSYCASVKKGESGFEFVNSQIVALTANDDAEGNSALPKSKSSKCVKSELIVRLLAPLTPMMDTKRVVYVTNSGLSIACLRFLKDDTNQIPQAQLLGTPLRFSSNKVVLSLKSLSHSLLVCHCETSVAQSACIDEVSTKSEETPDDLGDISIDLVHFSVDAVPCTTIAERLKTISSQTKKLTVERNRADMLPSLIQILRLRFIACLHVLRGREMDNSVSRAHRGEISMHSERLSSALSSLEEALRRFAVYCTLKKLGHQNRTLSLSTLDDETVKLIKHVREMVLLVRLEQNAGHVFLHCSNAVVSRMRKRTIDAMNLTPVPFRPLFLKKQ